MAVHFADLTELQRDTLLGNTNGHGLFELEDAFHELLNLGLFDEFENLTEEGRRVFDEARSLDFPR